jgi:hypothetical protein
MAKARPAKRTPKASGSYYGYCFWIWIGPAGKGGKWVAPSFAAGLGCKHGGQCVDANTLGVPGKPFELLVLQCKKEKGLGLGCSDFTCVYEYEGGQMVLQQNNCKGNCGCTNPDSSIQMKATLKTLAKTFGIKFITFCQSS